MQDESLVPEVVRLVFPPGTEITRKARDVPPAERFLVVPGRDGPRWILPERAAMGFGGLRQWRPYAPISRARWEALLLLYRAAALHVLPGVQSIGLAGARNAWFHVGLGESTAPTPLVYIGTRGLARKAVALLVDQSTRSPTLVLKAPISEAAGPAVVREARLLERLAIEKPGVAPELTYLDETQGLSLQTFVQGRPTGRRLTSAHGVWAQSMVVPGSISLKDFAERLSLSPSLAALEAASGRSVRAMLTEIRSRASLPCSWSHGDFAPWNLKWRKGRLAAVDWEHADPEGPPFYDLFYFTVIQNYLFRDNRSLRAVYRLVREGPVAATQQVFEELLILARCRMIIEAAQRGDVPALIPYLLAQSHR